MGDPEEIHQSSPLLHLQCRLHLASPERMQSILTPLRNALQD